MKGLKLVLQEGYVKVSYSHNNSRKRFPTGVKLESSNQLSSSGKLKGNIPDKENKQSSIDRVRYQIESIIRQFNLEYGVNPTIGELEKILKDSENKVHQTERVLDAYNQFFELKLKEFSDNKDRSKESIKEYRGLNYYLEDYEVYLEHSIRFYEIDKDWILDFKVFNEKPRTNGNGKIYKTFGGLRGNTIKKKINIFITFMKWASTKSYCVFPIEIEKFSKQIKSPEVVKGSLTKEEVLQIYKFRPSSKSFEIVRDIFVFSCLTGMRWSDLISVNKNHVKKYPQGLMIVKRAQKTDDEFSVFLNSISKSIIEKYDYDLNLMSNPAFNRTLKLFLQSTGLFNDETKFKEGVRRLHRWEIISIHRGRDTFITMLIEENVPLNVIMKYTGHKQLSTLEKYIDQNKKVGNFMEVIFKDSEYE
jgi:integrase